MSNLDLTQLAQQAVNNEKAAEPTQATPSLAEQMNSVAKVQQVMMEDPSKVEVTTVTDFANVTVGAPATKENLEAVKNGGELSYPSPEEYFEGANRGTQYGIGETTQAPSTPTLPVKEEAPVAPSVVAAETKTYDGPGLVMEEIKTSPTDTRVKDELPPEMKEDIDNYLDQMEQDFHDPDAIKMREAMIHVDPTIASREEVQKLLPQATDFATARFGAGTQPTEEPAKEGESEEEDLTTGELVKKRVEDFEKAVIVIDKLNADKLELNEEEQKVVERVNKIRVEEVEVVELSQLKRRRSKPGSVEKLLKRTPTSIRTTNVVLPASGYVATVAGCTPHELMTLQADDQNPLVRTQTIWSVIHSKIVDTSLGKMNFEKFMENTASVDQDVFIYGILQSTFPDDDTINLRCSNPECVDVNGNAREFQHKYSIRSLLRIEDLSEETQARIAKYIDSSISSEEALMAHDDSPVMQSLAIKLPESGIILELHLKSAYDNLNLIRESLKSDLDPKYAQAAIFATAVNVALIPPVDGSDEYSEIYDFSELTQVIYSLSNKDYVLFTHKASEFNGETSFNFGFIDVLCPHCHEHTEVLPLPIEEILFYRHSQAINTTVE